MRGIAFAAAALLWLLYVVLYFVGEHRLDERERWNRSSVRVPKSPTWTKKDLLDKAIEWPGVALVAALLALIFALAAPDPAQAQADCKKRNEWSGQCEIFAPPPPPDYPDPPGDQPGDPGGGGGSGQAQCVDPILDRKVPCIVGDWYWSYSWMCWTKYAEPQPPWSDEVWGGRRDGAIFWCSRGVTLDDPFPPDTAARWSATPPWGAPPPDPEDLARQAVESMNLRAGEIGIVPEEGPDRVGLLGLPTWMWVADVEGATWGPITRTATSGPWSVTATAKVDRIEWDMGDGTVVVCDTPGTPYEDRFQDLDSPDCGHRYQEQGRYTVTATSYWVIEWAGIGQTGTIEMDLTREAHIVMGEAQVISQ